MPERSTANGAQQAAIPENAQAQETDTPLVDSLIAQSQTEPQAETAAVVQPTELGKREEKLLDKLVNLFVAGSRKLLANRVECGKLAHEFFVERFKGGYKDRKFSAAIVFNRLAVHASSSREADGSELAQMYQTVQLLAVGADWARLDVGRLLALRTLVVRVPDCEEYRVFDSSKESQAREAFQWACGDGLKKPSIEEIRQRVLALVDPQKHAEAQKAKDAKDAQTTDEPASKDKAPETPAPENLISTDAARPAAPDWKDVPDGMSAQYNEAMRQAPQEMEMVREQLVAKLSKLPVADVVGWMTAFFQEGCKRNAGKSHEMLAGFAKQLVWTNPMVKGLIDGIADSKDADSAQEAMQTIVDTLDDEYGIYPQSEVESEKEAA
jgi:hypothetical protein